MLDSLLIREDTEVSQFIKERFVGEGIEVLTGHKAVEVRKAATGYELEVSTPSNSPLQRGRVPFDQILVAVGRAPNVGGLDLEKAGVRFSKKGIELGVTIVGPHAGDLLHELALAMYQKIGLKKVASMIHIYPTLAEISKRIADTYQRTRLTPRSKRWLERYFRWRFR